MVLAIALGNSGTGIDYRSDAGGKYLVVGGCVLIFTMIGLHNRWLVPRAGVVTFLEDRIVFERHRTKELAFVLTILWEEVAAFDDGETDYVRLVVPKRPNARAYVPTKDEETRVRVLRLLEDRGIRRHDR